MDDREWIDNLLLAHGVCRPTIRALSHKPVRTWDLLHPAAPFELELDQDEWQCLLSRSGYFESIHFAMMNEAPAGLVFRDLTIVDGVHQCDMLIPLCAKASLSDVLNAKNGENINYAGGSFRNAQSAFRKRHSKPVILVNMTHLLLAIILLCRENLHD